MFSFKSSKSDQFRSNQELLNAISRSQAIIEFDLTGRIVTANKNFLDVVGYELAEISGQHHSMFVDPAYAASEEYKSFWQSLRGGEFRADSFRRFGKHGKEIWIEASYNPIVDHSGKPSKIVKIATDITLQKQKSVDAEGQLSAISRSFAVIEFTLDGHILDANANFCKAMGYSLEEIKGQHHRMFVLPEDAKSAAYAKFWATLASGEFQAAEYPRVGKGGREVWIQASYNPILDADGKPYKVVKYARDVTARKLAVSRIGERLGRLADGDLTCRIEERFEGELDHIREAFNFTIDKFGQIVSRLVDTSKSLKSATGEILAGANDLSDRTAKQAAAVEQTSAALEQFAKSVNENAQKAQKASQGSAAAAGLADEGGTVMVDATTAMTRITTSSQKISNIIGLIDDIAFQTNLLALNASVEAARAGEAGKGFAVVAIEVRRLAQSAASASAEVKVLIEKSADEVQDGSRLVDVAAQKLQAILQSVTENSALMKEIAAANHDQTSSIGEVSSAIRQMDEMTQHNAALVEETNAAIEQTEEQATRLDRIIEVFRINEADKAHLQSGTLSSRGKTAA